MEKAAGNKGVSLSMRSSCCDAPVYRHETVLFSGQAQNPQRVLSCRVCGKPCTTKQQDERPTPSATASDERQET